MEPTDRRTWFLASLILCVAAGFLTLFVSKSSNSGADTVLAGLHQFSPLPPHGSSGPGAPVTNIPGRDPFDPLGSGPGASTGPGPTGSNPFGSPPPTSSPPIVSPPVSPPASPPASPGGGSSYTVGGHVVVLDDIFSVGTTKKAQVEVDGTVFTVAQGERFDDNFKLVSISGFCGNLLFADQSFRLCETHHK